MNTRIFTLLCITGLIGSASMAFALTTSAIPGRTTYTQAQLLRMAGNDYADGVLPLGDGRYTTDKAKKGYIYLCNVHNNERAGGAGVEGPWIDSASSTWDSDNKLSIQGEVGWPDARYSITTNNSKRILSGNGLPINHSTGTFPVSQSDPAYQYDRNPNSIKTQDIQLSLPVNPTYSETPYCIGGEVGIMNTGIALFNGFDALHRDAIAHEIQDSCDGHPQISGQYHYHGPSSCIKEKSIQAVIGYALDGFPITGSKVADNKYLTTADLDKCHGITSQIIENGKKRTTYHYVMTQDFPYSVSCFRGKPIQMQVVTGSGNQSRQFQQSTESLNGFNQPPQAAVTACSGKRVGDMCIIQTPRGSLSGSCGKGLRGESLACIPNPR